jgi:polyhydroxyalkanoate synthesis regulator phasin
MKNANKKITMNDLAVMVKNGFDETGGKIEEVRKEVKNLSETNAEEHEKIMLRLDNVAYRFELVELQKRVDVLEKKVGLRHK